MKPATTPVDSPHDPPHDFPLDARRVLGAALAIGLTKGAGQFVLLREFLQLADGNELTLGVYLLVWMAAEAAGSWFGRRRPGASGLRLVQSHFLMALVVVAAVVTARAVPLVSAVRAGEALGLLGLLVAAACFTGPLALLGGYQFALSVWAGGEASQPVPPGLVYTYEAAGHAAGAVLALGAILVGRTGLDATVWLGGVNLGTAAMLAAPAVGRAGAGSAATGHAPSASQDRDRTGAGARRTAVWGTLRRAAALAAALLMAWPLVARPFMLQADLVTANWRWPAQEVVYVAESPYARLSVARRDGQWSYYSHGLLEGFLPGLDPAVQLHTHRALLAHPDPRSVLVIGGLLGGAVGEARLHGPERLTYVALDSRLLDALAATQPHAGARPDGAAPAWRGVAGLEGSEVLVDDARAVVAAAQARFDVILLSTGKPGSLRVNRLLTVEFFRAAERALAAGGVLAVPVVISPAFPDQELAAAAHSVRRAMEAVFGQVAVLGGECATLLAVKPPGGDSSGVGGARADAGGAGGTGGGADTPLDLTPPLLAGRAAERGLGSFAASELFWRVELDPDRLATLRLATEMPPAWQFGGAVNSDRRPLAVFFTLARWHTMHHPGARPVWQMLWRGAGGLVAAFLALLAVATVAPRRHRRDRHGHHDRPRPCLRPRPPRHRLAVALSTAVVGFMAMVSHLLLMLTYQAYAGFVYRDAGILSGAFMLSLVAGARSGTAWAARGRGGARAAGVAAAWAAYLGLLLIGLTLWRPVAASFGLRAAIVGAVAAGGALTGLFFPAALSSLGRGDEAAMSPGGAGALESAATAGSAGALDAATPAPSTSAGAPAATASPAGRAGLLYACDLAGGGMGALVAAPVLLPALGLGPTLAALTAAAAIVCLRLLRLERYS